MASMTMADQGPADRRPRLDALLLLMNWLSPAFPVGGFSYSHGIEQAVEAGLVRDEPTARQWIARILAHGGVRVDSALLLAAHDHVSAGDRAGLRSVIELGNAWRGTAETALESRAQGQAFIATLAGGWPLPDLMPWLEDLTAAPYAVSVGAAAAATAIARDAALAAFLQAVGANLISAAVRLVPLGQTDGQKILRALTGIIPDLVETAGQAGLDEIGTATPMVDWTSMAHETQYTRLFRS